MVKPDSKHTEFFNEFKTERIKTSGATIHTVYGGNRYGSPVLLLHGIPETHVLWRKIAPTLAQDYFIVMTDLRGYGDSSKPPGGGDHFAYSKRAMAQDQLEVMRHLGFDTFALVGHDRGGRVAHRLALDYPRRCLNSSFWICADTPALSADHARVRYDILSLVSAGSAGS